MSLLIVGGAGGVAFVLMQEARQQTEVEPHPQGQEKSFIPHCPSAADIALDSSTRRTVPASTTFAVVEVLSMMKRTKRGLKTAIYAENLSGKYFEAALLIFINLCIYIAI